MRVDVFVESFRVLCQSDVQSEKGEARADIECSEVAPPVFGDYDRFWCRNSVDADIEESSDRDEGEEDQDLHDEICDHDAGAKRLACCRQPTSW